MVSVSDEYRSTTFSLRNSSLLGGQSVRATVYGEFSSLDYNSEMQLSEGEQIRSKMVSVTCDVVEKLLVSFLHCSPKMAGLVGISHIACCKGGRRQRAASLTP